jgi:hypothetical protein
VYSTSGFLIVASIALLAAGCGSSGPSSSSSTGNIGSSTPSNSPQGVLAAADKYATCMRAHGVTDFPDPQMVYHDGERGVKLEVGAADKGSPAFKAARQACKGILPGPGNGSPAQQAAQQQAHKADLLSFAACMRGHGISGFPDPDRQGLLTLQMVQAAGVVLHTHATLVAGLACVSASHGAISAANVEQATGGGQ